MSAIRIAGLRHVYPDGHTGLDGVDLAVAAGERVAVLGPNGAGKTTLMLHLNGVLTATSGTVKISG
ncbi:MAG: ATP-binding cassette domain-containing protein, partial [Mycobacterium sp.]